MTERPATQSPRRLLVIGDGGAPTGYARVIRDILNGLPADAFEIHHLAVNHSGDPHEEPWKLYPAGLRGDAYGVRRAAELMERVKPDVILSVADLWVQALYLKAIREFLDRRDVSPASHGTSAAPHGGASAGNGTRPRPRIVVYSPVDAGPVDPEWIADFPMASEVVVFTRFARREILGALGDAATNEIRVIPPAIDRATFRPLTPERPWCTLEGKRRLGLFPEEELESSFVVLNAHRNQPRKRIDITLKAFAEFARGKPANVQLYLHMGTSDMGWDIHKLSRRYGVADRLIVSENRPDGPGIASEDLNVVYNACDVGLSTATGEGWGLPNFEHAAAGKAQILPRLPTLEEIWGEAAEFVDPSHECVYEVVHSEGKVVSPGDVAAVLEALYTDRGKLRSSALRCLNVPKGDGYDAAILRLLWRQVLEQDCAPNGRELHAKYSG